MASNRSSGPMVRSVVIGLPLTLGLLACGTESTKFAERTAERRIPAGEARDTSGNADATRGVAVAIDTTGKDPKPGSDGSSTGSSETVGLSSHQVSADAAASSGGNSTLGSQPTSDSQTSMGGSTNSTSDMGGNTTSGGSQNQGSQGGTILTPPDTLPPPSTLPGSGNTELPANGPMPSPSPLPVPPISPAPVPPNGNGTPVINTPEQVAAKCDASLPRTTMQRVLFADPKKSCDWGILGNASIKDSEIRARREQTVSLALPADAIICDLNFAFSRQSMHYDDEILFTFNDQVLAASTDYSSYLPVDGDFVRYDWLKLLKKPYSHNAFAPYCAGEKTGDGTCVIPQTETTGTISLSFSQRLIHQLSAKAIAAKRFDLMWVTTGDNDDTDCQHSDFAFDVTITYVK